MQQQTDAPIARPRWMTLLVTGILLVAGGLTLWVSPSLAEGAWLGAAIALAVGRTGIPIGLSVAGRIALVAVPIVMIGTGMRLEQDALEPFDAVILLNDVPVAPEVMHLLVIAGGGAVLAAAAGVVASVLIVRSNVFSNGWGWLALPVLAGGAMCAIARDLIVATFAVSIGYAELDTWLMLAQFIGSVVVGGVLIFVAVVARSRMPVPEQPVG
ncbi:hypothetical protein FVO59_04275 [Microbacterium esteraromaticum]|uniref:Uncharacterized protein n=1 Tax=Microbacterium esteraromaticum TaxID=57043 RepID=A0A7D7WD75_9MICO|nr:hypothetical protein [Microbacterium esteraromaticum]QMU96512.1 hypothetical protein FVO59_04275 [Microbacterium esteraromaticum]